MIKLLDILTKKTRTRLRMVLIFAVIFSFIFEQQAYACLTCNGMVTGYDPMIWQDSEDDFDQKINDEFLRLERFIVYEMWRDSILPIMMLAAEQFTAVAIQQVMIIGTFLDAKHQLDTQQLLQVLQAKAHKDYHPSEGMCEFGTAMKALAASDMRSELTSFVMSQRSQDRQLGNSQSSGTFGFDLDKDFRISQFKLKYCDHKDRNTALFDICNEDNRVASLTTAQIARINSDIDYFETVDSPWTIKANFTNEVILNNEDEEDLLALGSNLFADKLFPRPPSISLQYIPDQPLSVMQEAYMDMRAIIAKRSVAENSFNAIAASKSEGPMATNEQGDPINGPGGTQLPMRSRPFLENIIRNLGVNTTEAIALLGNNPSYNAQMKVLTKKIFQSPDFYTNLYDKPANVKRKMVTLQAIKMMQKFDMLKSFLRNEASFSVLLELAITDLQKEIEDQIQTVNVSGRR